jgi:hypothetical protein
MDDNSSIFIKQSELPKEEHKFSYLSIKENIPEPSYNTQQPSLKKTTTEWRWRFYNIEGKKVVEISFVNKNSNERTYVDKYGNFIKSNVSKEFDKYLIEEIYCYSI